MAWPRPDPKAGMPAGSGAVALPRIIGCGDPRMVAQSPAEPVATGLAERFLHDR